MSRKPIRETVITPFLDTLAFFSCLVPARMYGGTRLHDCLKWSPAAGLVIGLLVTLAAFLFHGFLSLKLTPPLLGALLSATIWVGLEAFVSRALHWDGLADLADAIGSCREGEEFRSVLKDSRLGTFGAMALLACFAGQILGCSVHIEAGDWHIPVIAMAWARTAALLPYFSTPPYDKDSLGGRFFPGATPGLKRILLGSCTAMCFLLLAFGSSLWGVLLLVAGQFLVHRWICTRALAHGGLSGDFIGADIELSQLLVLLVCQ